MPDDMIERVAPRDLIARLLRHSFAIGNADYFSVQIIRVIEKAGYVIVPRAPTEAMVRAACDSWNTTPAGEWRAMIAAALGEAGDG